MKSYSQNFEDVLLNRIFKDINAGFYIDVGAHHPEELSVTKYFYDKGWSGINIEPVEESHRLLSKARPRDINLQIALGARKETKTFYKVCGTLKSGLDASALSSFDRDTVMDACRSYGLDYETIDVPVDTLQNICEQHCPDSHQIHFLKIDVEGFEAEVLQGANFIKFRPTVLVIESTIPNSNPLTTSQKETTALWDAFEPIIFEADYEFVYFDGLNRFYLAKESPSLKHLFSIPVGMFDGISVFSLLRQIKELSGTTTNQTEIENLNARLRTEILAYENLRKELSIQDNAVEKLAGVKRMYRDLTISMHARENALKNHFLGRFVDLGLPLPDIPEEENSDGDPL